MSLYVLVRTLQCCKKRFCTVLILNVIPKISKDPSNEPWGARLRYQVASQVWVNLFKHLQVVSKMGFYDNTLPLWGDGKPGKEGQVQGLLCFLQ